jgi:hypothetical protein
MQKRVKQIIKETAKKFQVPEQEIELLYKAQFKLVKRTFEEAEKNKPDTFKNVRLIKLGIFYVKDYMKKHIASKKPKNKEDEN